MRRIWIFSSVALVGASTAAAFTRPEAEPEPQPLVEVAPEPEPEPPKRNAELDAPLRDGQPPAWVTTKPPGWTQGSLSSRQRGINPCNVGDPGLGNHSKWDRAPLMGQMVYPNDLELDEDGLFDVMFHFHGHEQARREWVQATRDGVLVGIDLGNGSGPYLNKFAIKGQFEALVKSVERAITKRTGSSKPAKIRKLGLSSWSAGYGAIDQILRSDYGRERADLVILLDGLHTSYEGNRIVASKLEPFAEFARSAARDEKLMFVSHSSIAPPTYASTTETASYLIWQVGGTRRFPKAHDPDPMGLERVVEFDRGNFHVWGFSGNAALDHCAHIGLYSKVVSEFVVPRWKLEPSDTEG